MCVPCVSAIEILTTGPISMKFGMSILLNGGRGKVHSWDLTPYPNPWDQGGPKHCLACLCSLNRSIWRKLYKTKVVGRPCFSGGGSHFLIHNLCSLKHVTWWKNFMASVYWPGQRRVPQLVKKIFHAWRHISSKFCFSFQDRRNISELAFLKLANILSFIT